MLDHMRDGPGWAGYCESLGLSATETVQLGRLYALLHDIGHLPFSHLFELGFESYAAAARTTTALEALCQEWVGVLGYAKLHEACGAAIAPTIIEGLPVSDGLKANLVRLLTTKRLALSDPLRPIKQLVDSEVDADRIDSTARDGLLAGGEYGRFDIERLASSAFVVERDGGWTLAYSAKAVGPLEPLL